MTEAVCPQCKGSGIIRDPENDTTVRQCVCAYARALKAHLGPEIAAAPTIRESPLMQFGKVDRTTHNLFILSSWYCLLPHLKWALGCKGPHFYFRVVTDERLRSVYVGAEQYTARSKRRRDDMETYNSLSDLVVDGVDLLIIRLGFLGYGNRAMPGVLKETLMLRDAALKPTWVIDDPTNPFGEGHFAYSEETRNYLDRYEALVIDKSARKTPQPVYRAPVADEETGDISADGDEGVALVEAPSARPTPVRPPSVREAPQGPDMPALTLPGEGTPKKGGGKYRPPQRGGGGGPLGDGTQKRNWL